MLLTFRHHFHTALAQKRLPTGSAAWLRRIGWPWKLPCVRSKIFAERCLRQWWYPQYQWSGGMREAFWITNAVGRPRGPKGDQGRPKWTKGQRRKPRDTKGHQGWPRGTKGDQGRPRRAKGNSMGSREPTGTKKNTFFFESKQKCLKNIRIKQNRETNKFGAKNHCLSKFAKNRKNRQICQKSQKLPKISKNR